MNTDAMPGRGIPPRAGASLLLSTATHRFDSDAAGRRRQSEHTLSGRVQSRVCHAGQAGVQSLLTGKGSLS